MKRSLPLGGFGRRVVCAAGLAWALGSGLTCPAAFADVADQSGQALPAAPQGAGVDSAQLSELSAAAGRSSARLAAQIEDSLSQQGLAESFPDPSSGILPVIPYVFGAASALVGVGVFAGAFALLKRRFSRADKKGPDAPQKADSECIRDDAPRVEPPGWADDTFSFIAVGAAGAPFPSLQSASSNVEQRPEPAHAAPAFQGGPTGAANTGRAAVPSNQDSFDELERLAMGYVAAHGASARPPVDDDPDDGPGGGSAQGCGEGQTRGGNAAREAFARTDLTIPMDCVTASGPTAQDFATTARVLASGSGDIHRVTTPSSHLDFSGIDILSASAVQGDEPAANPMVCREDWQGVALSELRAAHEEPPSVQDGPSTAEYVALISTKAQPGLQAKREDFVAPVIGPGLDPKAAARRQELVRSSSSAAASLLVDRDEEFLAARRPAAASGSPSHGNPSEPVRPCDSSKAARRPGPAAAGSPSVRQRLSVDVQTSSVPGAGAFVPPRPPASPAVVSDRGLSAAVAAASAAYAAFNSYPTVVSAPVQERPGFRADRAASYAAAVYGSMEQSRSRTTVSPGTRTSLAAASGDAPDAVCGAYIDHMVQDEFEHRHDSPAQRNAALGRMQVIDGAAVAPVSVRDASRRNRA